VDGEILLDSQCSQVGSHLELDFSQFWSLLPLPHLLITIAQDYFRRVTLFVENRDLLKQLQLHPEKGRLEAVIAEVKPSTVI
jgi:hypothetical protein